MSCLVIDSCLKKWPKQVSCLSTLGFGYQFFFLNSRLEFLTYSCLLALKLFFFPLEFILGSFFSKEVILCSGFCINFNFCPFFIYNNSTFYPLNG